jgi:RNA polymerase-binding transcription factor DksA
VQSEAQSEVQSEPGDPERLDREPVGPGTELEVDESLLDAIENDLADVERALALLDEGTYGQCEVCSRSLDDAVLARAPATRFCPDHLPLSLP